VPSGAFSARVGASDRAAKFGWPAHFDCECNAEVAHIRELESNEAFENIGVSVEANTAIAGEGVDSESRPAPPMRCVLFVVYEKIDEGMIYVYTAYETEVS
jgi:hypothetical protein